MTDREKRLEAALREVRERLVLYHGEGAGNPWLRHPGGCETCSLLDRIDSLLFGRMRTATWFRRPEADPRYSDIVEVLKMTTSSVIYEHGKRRARQQMDRSYFESLYSPMDPALLAERGEREGGPEGAQVADLWFHDARFHYFVEGVIGALWEKAVKPEHLVQACILARGIWEERAARRASEEG